MQFVIAAIFSLVFVGLCVWLAMAGMTIGAGFAGFAAFLLAARAVGMGD